MIIKINGNNFYNNEIDLSISKTLNLGLANTNDGETFSGGIIHDFKNFMEFTDEVKKDGLFHAIYGKSFFEVCRDFFAELLHDIGLFILSNGDLFFLMPAIAIMFITFLIGRNKYTKWIIPLWFGYFVTTVLYKIML